MMNEMIKCAICYAEMGYDVVPLQCYGKHMFNSMTFRTPCKDLSIIEYWWKKIPNASIGLPTSLRYNGLVIIDIDIKTEWMDVEVLRNLKPWELYCREQVCLKRELVDSTCIIRILQGLRYGGKRISCRG